MRQLVMAATTMAPTLPTTRRARHTIARPILLAVDDDWEAEHCAGRDCYYVMQGTEGASDTECNGRHPEDLGTSDDAGKRDRPFASLTGPVRELLAPPPGEPARSRTVFVGEGSCGVAPWRLRLRGDGGRGRSSVPCCSPLRRRRLE